MFPPDQTPENTKDYEPYYYPVHLVSTTDETKLVFILRNFDEQDLDRQIKHIEEGVAQIQAHYSDFPIKLQIKKGKMIGKTKDVIFLLNGEKVEAIPILSLVKEIEIIK